MSSRKGNAKAAEHKGSASASSARVKAQPSSSLFSCWSICKYIVVAATAAAAYQYFSLAADQPFVLKTTIDLQHNPPASAYRHRVNQYTVAENRTFIQWWNYAVVDAETKVHWTIAFGIMTLLYEPEKRIGSFSYIQRVGTEVQAELQNVRWMDNVTYKVFNECDVIGLDKTTGKTMFKHVVSADGQRMTVQVDLPDLAVDLLFVRVNGWYSGGSENPKLCHQTSTMYAYHSKVSGSIVSKGRKFELDPSPTSVRFRAYGGSTWGCYLPFGTPPIEYPWTWIWLVIPNADPAKEIGIAAGTIRYQQYPDFGVLGRDFYAAGAFVDIGQDHHWVSSARAFHKSPFETYLVGSVSPQDGYFSAAHVDQSDWRILKDDYGESLIPYTQTFTFRSQKLELIAQTRAKEGEIFRISFMRELNMYSDFRANGVDVHVLLRTRHANGTTDQVLYDGMISSPFSAVEYAYVDPYPTPASVIAAKRERVNFSN